ncbi:MAG: DUF1667 domain-containing protein [Clostridia bacterium]|jgi:CxxC motif-containing protein|nr:DUF1667 domain-containing protein [Clostridia bacterium]MBT7122413.1 DUF1667 domain-containing protein [Clostridia bacterium]
MNKEIMCVLCPNSCHLKIEYDESTKEITSLTGGTCKRAHDFALQEITNPMRTLTFSVLVSGGTLPLISTRSEGQIPLTDISKYVTILKGLQLPAPVLSGDVVFQDDSCKIIATKNVNKHK